MNRKTGSILMIAVVCGLGAMLASSQMLAGSPAPAVETQQVGLVLTHPAFQLAMAIGKRALALLKVGCSLVEVAALGEGGERSHAGAGSDQGFAGAGNRRRHRRAAERHVPDDDERPDDPRDERAPAPTISSSSPNSSPSSSGTDS